MIFIAVLALLLFGPKRLPKIARELGKALNEFKRASNEFKSQLETELAQVEATEQKKTLPAPASAEFSADPMQQPIPQPIEGVTVEPRILPPAEPAVATTIGQTMEAGQVRPSLPAAEADHDSNLVSSNLAAPSEPAGRSTSMRPR